jgi:hypothetical protein
MHLTDTTINNWIKSRDFTKKEIQPDAKSEQSNHS